MSKLASYVGLSVPELLCELSAHPDVQTAIPTLLEQCGDISRALRSTRVTAANSTNTFGEQQLSVDLEAQELLMQWAKGCPVVRAVSSEEATQLKEMNAEGSLVVCWDPLDGSSIVDCNWAVASIFGIWQVGQKGLNWNGENTLIGATGRQQVCSLLVIYGPRTTALLSVCGHTFDLQLADSSGESPVVVKSPCTISKTGAKIFSPANLRAAQDLPAYNALLQQWMKDRLTLRYTGGIGPDVYQLFIKSQGVFCNPASPAAPAKLRLAYEVAPIAFLVEAAGGATSTGSGSALDVPLQAMDHRTPFCCGTEEEVKKFESF
ncbi:sedoheptulose-1,7-bisphosphatase, chloroplastic [Cyclospora cayetanensis]|uniref:Sedoheptulose-1,7-bisphosphatase, chloroplastic n=1 Tax=Cyclospora cayetanensis TaxID=88456 RepID=A0A6P6RT92_9EIME|nr:sedoheptulose-1,7-bisphosphatase, chloroplastic [Cyclospora cayetanensis]